MFAQSVCSPSYCVVKRCDFDLVNKIIIHPRRSVSVCCKVCKSVLVNVSNNVFHVSAPDNLQNVTIMLPYQHFNSTKYISKCALSASAVSFIPVTTLTVNPAMSLHVCNVLVSVNTTWRVHKVSPYIPLSVNSSTTHVDYVSHVQHSRCLSFRSKVSVAYNFKYVSLSPLYTILVVIFFNTFSFTQSAKATSALLLYFY